MRDIKRDYHFRETVNERIQRAIDQNNYGDNKDTDTDKDKHRGYESSYATFNTERRLLPYLAMIIDITGKVSDYYSSLINNFSNTHYRFSLLT